MTVVSGPSHTLQIVKILPWSDFCAAAGELNKLDL